MASKEPKNTTSAKAKKDTRKKTAPQKRSAGAGGKPTTNGEESTTSVLGDGEPPVEDNATPISQAAYARRCNVSPQFINKLVKQEIIMLDSNGKVIPHLADKARATWADPSRTHRTKENTPDNGKAGSITEGEPDDFSDEKMLEAAKDMFNPEEIKLLEELLKKMPNYNGARRLLEVVKAQNELLEYQQARGLVVEAAETEIFWAEKLAMVKTKLLSIPRKMAQEVASLVLQYAAKFGRELSKNVDAIKKKKSGKWLYNKKAGALELYSGKVKKPLAVIALSMEAPEHAESMVINETETALSTEVYTALNELAGEKESE